MVNLQTKPHIEVQLLTNIYLNFIDWDLIKFCKQTKPHTEVQFLGGAVWASFKYFTYLFSLQSKSKVCTC